MKVSQITAALALITGLWGTSVHAAEATEVQTEVEAVIQDMARRWAKDTWPTIHKDLWDANEPMPMYLAEEEDGWRVGWDEMNNYFSRRGGAGFLQATEYNASDIKVRLVSKDIAIATWNIYWQMKMRPTPPIAERLRATGVFRKTKAGWKFIHYAEAPKSPAAYIQELYGDRVSPAFRERIAKPTN
jgi:hypothetical protein